MAKTVLITGVSRGLGLTAAGRLLDAGWTVCGTSRTDSEAWRKLAARVPGRAEWRPCDLGRPEAVSPDLFEHWLPLERPIHAYVNNAAAAYDDLVTNVRLPALEEMFAVNVFSPIMITRHVLRNMLLHGTRGAIVHVSSVSVHAGAKGLAMLATGGAAAPAIMGYDAIKGGVPKTPYKDPYKNYNVNNGGFQLS